MRTVGTPCILPIALFPLVAQTNAADLTRLMHKLVDRTSAQMLNVRFSQVDLENATFGKPSRLATSSRPLRLLCTTPHIPERSSFKELYADGKEYISVAPPAFPTPSESSRKTDAIVAPSDSDSAAETIRKAEIGWNERVEALQVPIIRLHSLRKDPELRPFLYSRRGKSNVIAHDSENFKLLLLAPGIRHDMLPEVARGLHESMPHKYYVQVGYDDLDATEALQLLLPKEIHGDGVPTGFATVGHLAHMNLKERFWPWRFLIGRVILDKHSKIATVISKVGTLANEFRTFDMEVIAGENRTQVSCIDNGITLSFDYRKVYWNSRLDHERGVLLESVTLDDVVCDLFAGVGAFAIMCAAKGCRVVANDLNPAATDAQRQNALANAVSLEVLNMDARTCVKELEARPQLNATVAPDGRMSRMFVIMNLPELALDFLDVFRDAVAIGQNKLFSSSRYVLAVRCYCFAKAEPPEEEIHRRLVAALGVVPTGTRIREVRSVAPGKTMYRVDFDVPAAL